MGGGVCSTDEGLYGSISIENLLCISSLQSKQCHKDETSEAEQSELEVSRMPYILHVAMLLDMECSHMKLQWTSNDLKNRLKKCPSSAMHTMKN